MRREPAISPPARASPDRPEKAVTQDHAHPILQENRAFHLGARDAYYDLARERLCGRVMNQQFVRRLRLVRRVQLLLHEAAEHARMAGRGQQIQPHERHFLKYLRLVIDAVSAMHAMTRHEWLLAADRSFLSEFMGRKLKGLGEDEDAYRNRIRHILGGLRKMLRMSQNAVAAMRGQDLAAMDGPERERYRRAYATIQEDVGRRFASLVADEDGTAPPDRRPPSAPGADARRGKAAIRAAQRNAGIARRRHIATEVRRTPGGT